MSTIPTNSPLQPLADEWGVDVSILHRLGITREPDGWLVPERDADGEVIGWAKRYSNGRKGFVSGGKRGLTMQPLHPYDGSSPLDPVLLVEGASDCASGEALGFATIGRPSATGGLDQLRPLLKDRHVVVVGEHDGGAGRVGARKMADGLAGVAASVRVIYPPGRTKDLRAWKQAGVQRSELMAAIENGESVVSADGDDAAPPSADAPVLVRLADVEPERIVWLWPGRIARGKLGLIAGNGGLGKSTVTLDIAARVTTGSGWPDRPYERFEPGNVILLSAEDGVADTIRPRLDAAGADVTRVFAFEAVRVRGDNGEASERGFCLATDVRHLEAAINTVGDVRLVIIDPVTAYLGATNDHRNAEVRGLLAPLSSLAAKYRVAVLAVSHLNKGQGEAIHRIVGSIAWAAAARTALAFAKDPDDPQRRLMLSVKSNIAAEAAGMAYRLSESPDHPGVAVVEWEAEPVAISADEAMSGGATERPGPAPVRRDAAVEWLRKLLADGPMAAAVVKEEAAAAGFTWRTVQNAAEELRVYRRKAGFGGGWRWSLTEGADGSTESPSPNNSAPSGGTLRLREHGSESPIMPRHDSIEQHEESEGAELPGTTRLGDEWGLA